MLDLDDASTRAGAQPYRCSISLGFTFRVNQKIHRNRGGTAAFCKHSPTVRMKGCFVIALSYGDSCRSCMDSYVCHNPVLGMNDLPADIPAASCIYGDTSAAFDRLRTG